jgi:hypothetical protein
MTDIQPDYTPFLNLVRPDTHDDVQTTINKLRDAIDAIDAWAQAHDTSGSPALSGLSDVSLSALSDGEVLTWLAGPGFWGNRGLAPSVTFSDGVDYLTASDTGDTGNTFVLSNADPDVFTPVAFGTHVDGTSVSLASNQEQINGSEPGLYQCLGRVQWSADSTAGYRHMAFQTSFLGVQNITLQHATGHRRIAGTELPGSRFQYTAALVPLLIPGNGLKLAVSQDSGVTLQIINAQLFVLRVL